MTKTILVTGGTGFVGSWMRATEPVGVKGYYLNRSDYYITPWHSYSWDAIVHLAPVSPFDVLQQATRFKARVLYCSSGIVYHPENNTLYRRNKLKWELMCKRSGVDHVIARLFTFYGAGLDSNKAIVQFEKAAKAGEPLVIYGDGETVRTYMHGAEMGRLMWAILDKGERGSAYDVGGDVPITMLQLARKIISRTKSKSKIVIQNGQDPCPVYIPPNTRKTKRLLE